MTTARQIWRKAVLAVAGLFCFVGMALCDLAEDDREGQRHDAGG